MPTSPANLLERLEELKKWQETQQERLLQRYNKTLQGNETLSEAKICSPGLEEDVSSDEESILYPSMSLQQGNDNQNGVKRQFLRRGAGLARFRMAAGEQFRPFRSKKPRNASTTVDNKPRHSFKRQGVVTTTPLNESIAGGLQKATWSTVLSNKKSLEEESQSLELDANNMNTQINNSTISNNNTDKELQVFENLERRTMQSSFCSTNSSVLRLLSSTPTTPKDDSGTYREKRSIRRIFDDGHHFQSIYAQYDSNVGYEARLQNDYLSLIEEAIKFKQFVTSDGPNSIPSTASSVTSDDATAQNEEFTATDFDKRDACTMTESVPSTVDEKLMTQLQKDAEDVRLRAVQLDKLKDRLERDRRDFDKLKKRLLKEIEDERTKIGSDLEAERKKLAKERTVFDRYVKDARNKPSKKEREEKAALKTEVAALKETLRAKETRSGTTQARLRNQIKNLEKENAALKAEVDNLNAKIGRLTAERRLSRAGPVSDTKLLHEINRHLSKLSQDAKEETATPTTDDRTAKRDESAPVTDCEVKKTDRTEETLEDGTIQVRYGNGNVKQTSRDGNHVVFKYYNGDVKETNLLEGTVRYLYRDSKVTHTTYADGTELVEFPDGQRERRLQDGVCEILYQNGTTRRLCTEGTEEITYPDGTKLTTNADGDRILSLPNGQTEIHTRDHKRREYPDGTVKTLYPDGLQETRYPDGRIRLKDRHGQLLMDSKDDA